jgi:hypothetical protein
MALARNLADREESPVQSTESEANGLQTAALLPNSATLRYAKHPKSICRDFQFSI